MQPTFCHCAHIQMVKFVMYDYHVLVHTVNNYIYNIFIAHSVHLEYVYSSYITLIGMHEMHG